MWNCRINANVELESLCKVKFVTSFVVPYNFSARISGSNIELNIEYEATGPNTLRETYDVGP
jgi:hypothetical protein